MTAADQFAEFGASFRLGAQVNRALPNRDLVRANPEPLGAQLKQYPARFRGRVSQRIGAPLDAGTAAGAPLIDRERSIAHDHVDLVERQIQFFGDDLGDGNVHALPHVHLAEESRHPAALVDLEISIELPRREGAPQGPLLRRHSPTRRRGHQRNDQAPPPFNTSRRFTFVSFQPIAQLRSRESAAAARLTARRIAEWEPQRHFSPVNAWRMASSLGSGSRSSSAAA